MDLQADLKWIHQELDSVKDPTIIEAIKDMLKYRTKKVSDRISIEQYNKEIDVSIEQIESGKTYTYQQMADRIAQWKEQ